MATQTITLRNKDILESQQAFAALDKCTFEPKVMLNLAKVSLALKNAAELILGVREKLAKEYFPKKDGKAEVEGKVNLEDPAFPAFRAKVEETLEATSEISGVTMLSVEDLKLDKNTIPVSVLATLNWLINS